MSLIVHRARRADELVPGLAGLLREPLEDAFQQELVLVPARGVERWLSQQLSHLLGHGEGGDDGVCAGVEFRSPASLVAELVLGGAGTREHDPWSPDALVWPLLAVVDAHAGEDWCRVLSQHLGHGEAGEEGELRRGRRYAVARRLAQLFASYAVQRPTLLEEWEQARDTDGAGEPLDPDLAWQPELWRLLVAEVGAPSPRERHRGVLAALRERPGDIDLPDRFSLFGHTRIPVTEVELLGALGEHRDVHVWLPHPSDALWQASRDLTGVVPRAEDSSHARVGHPLLASLGRDGRELERALVAVASGGGPFETGPDGPPQGPGASLLSLLQGDIAANATVDPATRALAPADHSVQVHACHGPSRQVEVLREVLLGLLSDDPTLEPRDILVMCPDIESYAPLIEAAFGMGQAVAGGHPGQQLQVRLADRALTQTNPLLAVVGKLLDLAGGRAEASTVLDLVASEPVRRRFGLADSDLETITGWVEQAGIRWAYDAEHREPYHLEGFVQNTWRFGVDRVLAGVAMSDDAERWIGTTLPLDDVGSTNIDLAGRLAELLDRLQHVTDRLTGSHPVDDWLDALREGIAALTSVARGEEWQTAQVQRELSALAVDAQRPGAALELRLPDVRALMAERLAGQPTRANFRTGTLTVCTMVPMRSVPHRVVCLLGLDDGVYPRASAVDGDNVLARCPLTGERDLRSEDRQLMLDAIMAAQEHLVVTYSGANETNGQPRPPAVPLGELLDALDDTVVGGRAHALRAATPGTAVDQSKDGHPLQAFDPCNFTPPVPFSFDRASLAGARAALRPRGPVPTLADATLPARPSEDLELASLMLFFRHPVKAFLRDRLGVTTLDEGEEVADGLPVELDNLQQWNVGDRLLRDLLRGRTPDQALGTEWRRGVLPPGRLGWRLGQSLTNDAGPVAELVESVTQGQEPHAVDVDVDLGEGRRLRGTVSGVHDHRVVSATFSRLGPRQWLEAWIPLLALCATYPGRPWSAGAVGRGEKGRHGAPDDPVARIAFASVEGATELLRELVTTYDAGMCAPLPLPLKTGHAWAGRRRPGNNNEYAARKDAEFKWLSNRFPGENADAAHVAVWGPDAPLEVLLGDPFPGEDYPGETTRLGALAMRLWRPMIERRH